jgi:hypothetical protein
MFVGILCSVAVLHYFVLLCVAFLHQQNPQMHGKNILSLLTLCSFTTGNLVDIFAGSPSSAFGYLNGFGTNALFHNPLGIALSLRILMH